MTAAPPTPYAALNDLLFSLVHEVRAILGTNLSAAYLHGSFALGGFDEHSDVDLLFVIENDVEPAQEAALQTMHAAIYERDTPWAQHLELSYVPAALLRRPDPARTPLLYLDNGSRELIRSNHDNTLVVRRVVREHGIALVGPPPSALIDPVAPDDLKREVRHTMQRWAERIFANPDEMNNGWYQPFVVLTLCRMLYTLETGAITSKPAAAAWAQQTLDQRWADLIRRAWNERPDPSFKVTQPAQPEDVVQTLDFVRYALDRA